MNKMLNFPKKIFLRAFSTLFLKLLYYQYIH